MSERNFFAELKRRNVYKVAVAYIVGGWALSQGIAQVFPVFEVPNWVIRLIVTLIILGLPVATVLAWMFELTPTGIKRTEVADAMPATARKKNHAWIYVVLVGGVVSIGLFFLGRYSVGNKTPGTLSNQPSSKSVAVLPFDNLSRDPDNAYFCEGVQDEILTRLARIADLKVISRTSTQHFKSAPENLPEIAKQLGVTNILEGSVQKVAGQVRVNVQLINALNDAHLWAETYDRSLNDIFAVESEIAKVIADTLQAKLTGQEERAIAVRPTENPEAYQLYLQGRFFWNKRTTADLQKSVDYFEQALAKDHGYALAYAGLAQAWMLFPAYNGGAPADYYPKAAEAAKKALELDNSLSDAITVNASLKAIYEFDLIGSASEYKRAIQLNANDATTHHWFATDVLAFTGQQGRELAEMKRALELDPLSLIINLNLGVAYMDNGRFDQAIAQFRKTLEMDNNFAPGHWHYAQVLTLQGKISDAIAECEKAVSPNGDGDPRGLGLLGYLYGLAGRKNDAQSTLEKLRQLRTQRYTLAYSLALASLGVNDKAAAITWLEQGYTERDGENIGRIRVDQFLNSLEGDPRFEALAEKIVPARLFKSTTAFK